MVVFNLKVDRDMLIEAIDQKMDEVVDFVFAQSQKNIVNKQIIDEGTLLKSGNINRELLDKELVYSVPYSDSIEYGRLPGVMPPVQPIQEWVRRKLRVSDEKEAKRISWAIVKDIEKNGTQARPFLRPAIESAKLKYGTR